MPRRAVPKRSERGAALLTVLMLVAVMAIVTAVALERLTLATRLAGNSSALDQARAYALAAETLSAARIGDLVAADPGKTTLRGDWNGRVQPVPIPDGLATARVSDSGNCFNLNSVVAGEREDDLKVRPLGVNQFIALMQALGINPREAYAVAYALADWVDTDTVPQSGGAEDETYARAESPYRTANRFLMDASELRAVAGVTPAVYAALKPWICALPTADLSPININTLLPEQAPLFAMLMPGQMPVEKARQLLAQRPQEGYGSLVEFWALPALAGETANPEVQAQTKLTTRWFRVEITVELGGAEVTEIALMDAQATPARLVRRQWGEAG